jgi:hypothetical protein
VSLTLCSSHLSFPFCLFPYVSLLCLFPSVCKIIGLDGAFMDSVIFNYKTT